MNAQTKITTTENFNVLSGYGLAILDNLFRRMNAEAEDLTNGAMGEQHPEVAQKLADAVNQLGQALWTLEGLVYDASDVSENALAVHGPDGEEFDAVQAEIAGMNVTVEALVELAAQKAGEGDLYKTLIAV